MKLKLCAQNTNRKYFDKCFNNMFDNEINIKTNNVGTHKKKLYKGTSMIHNLKLYFIISFFQT